MRAATKWIAQAFIAEVRCLCRYEVENRTRVLKCVQDEGNWALEWDGGSGRGSWDGSPRFPGRCFWCDPFVQERI